MTPTTPVPAGGWTKYRLMLCPTNPTGACRTQDCSPALAPPAATTCPLTGLNQNTTYNVTAAGVQGSLTSLNSTAQSFKVPPQE